MKIYEEGSEELKLRLKSIRNACVEGTEKQSELAYVDQFQLCTVFLQRSVERNI